MEKTDDIRIMLSLHLLVPTAGSLAALWLALAAWVLAARLRFDRRRSAAARDGRRLERGALDLEWWSRRRLWLLADGAGGEAATAAARELVRRGEARLVGRARSRRGDRMRAMRVLARGGSSFAPDLLARLRAEGTPRDVADIVAVAAELETPAADDILLDVLVRGDHPRSRVATVLAPRVPRLVGPLCTLVRHPDAGVRYWALMLLRDAAPEPRVRALAVGAASDEDGAVRGAVARVLGRARAQDTLPVLRSLLSDESFFVRAHAVRAVGSIGAEGMAAEVAALLADESWWTRAAVKESLLRLGDAGFAAAERMLAHPDRFARDGAAEVVGAFERAGDGGTAWMPELLAG